MSCADFVAQSFALRTAAHLAHLSATSYAHHMALGDFYEALTDLIDRYAEVSMGREGRIRQFPSHVPPRSAPTDALTQYLTVVKEEMKDDRECQALYNILTEIEELTLRTLYKLKNLA